jgi:hypothetical protein
MLAVEESELSASSAVVTSSSSAVRVNVAAANVSFAEQAVLRPQPGARTYRDTP